MPSFARITDLPRERIRRRFGGRRCRNASATRRRTATPPAESVNDVYVMSTDRSMGFSVDGRDRSQAGELDFAEWSAVERETLDAVARTRRYTAYLPSREMTALESRCGDSARPAHGAFGSRGSIATIRPRGASRVVRKKQQVPPESMYSWQHRTGEQRPDRIRLAVDQNTPRCRRWRPAAP